MLNLLELLDVCRVCTGALQLVLDMHRRLRSVVPLRFVVRLQFVRNRRLLSLFGSDRNASVVSGSAVIVLCKRGV